MPDPQCVKAWVRLARPLWLFVARRHRKPEIAVSHDGTATLGHLVESLGVPLTEVGTLFVNGVPSPPRTQPGADAVLSVLPIHRPQQLPSTRFLLDVHLGALARRLRLLGINAEYRNDATDDELIERAEAEHRVLLTQDRGLLRRRVLWAGAYVHGWQPDDQLADILNRFELPLAPWTRCMACNGSLHAVSKKDIEAHLEAGTKRTYEMFVRCDSCGKIFWQGAHNRRLNTIVAMARRCCGRQA